METEIVCKIAAKVLGLDPSSVNAHSLLTEELGADSLDLMKMAVEIEKRTQTPVDHTELMEARTVEDLAFFM